MWPLVGKQHACRSWPQSKACMIMHGASRQPRCHSVTCNNKIVAQPQWVELWSPWSSSCRSAPASTIRGHQAKAARLKHESSIDCDPERIHKLIIYYMHVGMHECACITSSQLKNHTEHLTKIQLSSKNHGIFLNQPPHQHWCRSAPRWNLIASSIACMPMYAMEDSPYTCMLKTTNLRGKPGMTRVSCTSKQLQEIVRLGCPVKVVIPLHQQNLIFTTRQFLNQTLGLGMHD